MTAEDERLRELAAAAEVKAPGPWFHDEAGYRPSEWPEDMLYRRVVRGDPHPVSGWRECVVSTHGGINDTSQAHRNEVIAAFIAAANPTAILALLDERDELQAAVERSRALVPAYAEEPHSNGCGMDACVRCVVDEFTAALDGGLATTDGAEDGRG